MKKPLIILTGPTAVGKTDLSILLAKSINGEIISADSMQVYKYMDIGTAKITRDEMQGVTHYLVDELDPRDEFHVVRFSKMAKDALTKIYEKGKIPIIVGGTGFYIQALLYDIDFSDTNTDKEYRLELENIANEQGNEELHRMLMKVDPPSGEMIHANNVKKVIRALEYYKETGVPISKHNQEQHEKQSPYNFMYFVLNNDRAFLYERINLRIDQMIDNGLIEEVTKLKELGYTKNLVSMQGLGYKEILSYLQGDMSYDEAIFLLKRDTRHFAKRQLTWFKREKEVTWVDKQNFAKEEDILNYMMNLLKEKGIIERKY